ncbi:hypothetical protein EPN81_00440 [Patescibacteria group bacterium]|nr:MAG: hypothetical protein EPN81_00440 [Patescibacteria group bacterium]
MDQKSAWEALFSQQVPTGVDLDEAEKAIEGIDEVDPSITLEPGVQARVNEYLIDPDTFVAGNQGDPRVPRWTRHAKSIDPMNDNATGQPPSAVPSSDGTPAPSAPAQAPPSSPLKASALRASGNEPAGQPSLGGVIERGSSSNIRPGHDERGRDSRKPAEPQAGDQDQGQAVAPVTQVSTQVVRPVRSFSEIEDGTRTKAELLREETATKVNETPAQRKKRLDDEAAERQRRFDQDAAECARRQRMEEEARKRRIADEAAAAEVQRLADLRLADEKRQLDEAADERKRHADLRLADEKRRLGEEAEERKLKRKEKADERKRLADEAARLARKAAERAEAEPPPPPPEPTPDPGTRVSVQAQMILGSVPYLRERDVVLELFKKLRAGDISAGDQLLQLETRLRAVVRAMPTAYMEYPAAQLLVSLIDALRRKVDEKEKDWFQANYITGVYGAG